MPGRTTMNPNLTNGVRSNWLSGKMLVAAVVLVAALIPSAVAQDNRERNCTGLYAAIRGELVRRDPPYTQPPFVMLTFILLNDSEAPVNAVEGGWKIINDGKELRDSDFIFGNGPQPVGGYGTLKPGESYEFGKGLELSRYFSKEREYKVSWKGKGFQSSTITVKGDASLGFGQASDSKSSAIIDQIMTTALSRCYSTVNGVKRISFEPATNQEFAKVEALGQKAVAPLAKYLDLQPKNGFTQLFAVKFLMAIGDSSTLGPLKRAFAQDQWEVTRDAALDGIFAVSHAEAKPYVEAALGDSSLLVRRTAHHLLALYQQQNK
jgi:hypothetical protein